MQFAQLKKEIQILYSKLSELQSALYSVVPFHIDGNMFSFISYFDLEKQHMSYTLLDGQGQQVRMMEQVPPEVIIEYSQFMEKIREWETAEPTENVEFPYADYTGPEAIDKLMKQQQDQGHTNMSEAMPEHKFSGTDLELYPEKMRELLTNMGTQGSMLTGN